MGFTKRQVSEITGIYPRLIHLYIANKAIVPRMKGEGRGIRWHYTRQTLIELFLIKELSGFGISIGRIKKIMDRVREIIRIEKAKGNPVYLFISHNGEDGLEVQAVWDRKPSDIYACTSFFVINYKLILNRLG